jgi:membrane-bound lytic murein transglycosylase B
MKVVLYALAVFGTLSACTSNAAAPGAGGYAASPAAQTFIDEMVTQHGFDRDELVLVFSQAQRREDILELMRKPAEKRLEWYEYRKIFLTRNRIDGGVSFWNNNAQLLEKAEKELGVDAQVIVAIIGVETRYGGNTGRHRVIDALSTLAFDYPPRSEFFRSELEQYLILAREEDIDLLTAKGSYAGAMGYGQFIPSSYRNFAIDFDADGKRDLWNSPADIIGSVANYMKVHGWTLGTTVATRATVTGDAWQAVLKQGLEPHTPVGELRRAGIVPQTAVPDDSLAALIELQDAHGPEYWLGLNNFYVITRYNHSPLYAMAVYQLSEEIRQAREQAQQIHD